MRRVGMIVAAGFLLASAFMNFRYGHGLGRTPIEAWIYGGIGVLAVACNGLCPFFIAWHAKRRALVAAIVLLWALSLTYSLSSAIGFAAENRQALFDVREAARSKHAMTLASLADLEDKRAKVKTSRYDERIEALRAQAKQELAEGGNMEVDPQSRVLSAITLLDAKDVRLLLVLVFAVMVELGAALVLFASVNVDSAKAKAPPAPMWRPRWQR